jgi:hypothetical protein
VSKRSVSNNRETQYELTAHLSFTARQKSFAFSGASPFPVVAQIITAHNATSFNATHLMAFRSLHVVHIFSIFNFSAISLAILSELPVWLPNTTYTGLSNVQTFRWLLRRLKEE